MGQADKEIDSFIKRTKAKLEKDFTINLNARGSGSGGGSGGRGGSSGMSDLEKEAKKAADAMERNGKRAEKAYKDMVSQIRMEELRLGSALVSERKKTVEKLQSMLDTYGKIDPDRFRRAGRELIGNYSQQIQLNSKNNSAQSAIDTAADKRAQREIDAAQKARDGVMKAYQDMVSQLSREETRLGSSLINERKKTLDKLKDMLMGYGAARPSDFRRDGRELIAEYAQKVALNKKDDSAQRAVDAAAERSARASADRLYEIKANALQRAQLIETRSGQDLTQLRQATEARINDIVQNSAGKRVNDVQRAVNRELAIYKLAASQQRQVQATQQPGNGKGVMYAFQAQQAIEDFSFAGLRGASNNIAFMASQLGGPAGLIAMLGLIGVTLAPTIYKLSGVKEKTDEWRNSLEGLNASLLSITNIDFESQLDVFGGANSIDQLQRYKDAVVKARMALNSIRQETVNDNGLQGVLSRALEAQRVISSLGAEGGQGVFNRLATEAPEAKLNNAREALARIREELRAIEPLFNWDAIFAAQDPIKAIEDSLKSIRDRVNENNFAEVEALKNLERAVELEKKRRNEFEAYARARERLGISGTGRITADELRDAFVEDDPAKLRDIEYRKKRVKLEDDFNLSLKATDGRIEGRTQKLRDEIVNLEAGHKAQLDAAEAMKDAEKDALDAAKERVRTQEQQNKQYENEIKQIEEVKKKLKEAAAEQQNSFGEKQFDTLGSASKNKNAYLAEKWKQYYGVDISPNEDYKKLVGGSIDKYFNAMSDYEAKYLAKAQQSWLKSQAEAAFSAGNFEEHGKSLGKLQDFQLSQASAAKTPQEFAYWWGQAQKTQEIIIANYKLQEQAEQEKINKLEKQIQSVAELEAAIKALEDAAKNVPQVDLKDPALIPWLNEVEERLNRLRALAQVIPNAPVNPFAGGGGAGVNPLNQPQLAGGGPEDEIWWNDGVRNFGGPRASGGPVDARHAYLVGEHGPELIMPNASGYVLDARTSAMALSAAMPNIPQANYHGGVGASVTNNNHNNQMNVSGPIVVQAGSNGTIDDIAATLRREAASVRIRRGM